MFTKLITEFVGVFFLVLVIALTGNPVAIGFGLMVLVYMGGHISGAHYNPAISFGAWLSKAISTKTMLLYWFVQMIGAVVATVLAAWLISWTFTPSIGEGTTIMQAVTIEALFTFLLVLVVLNVAVSKKTKWNSFYGLAIWLTVLMAAFAGGPLSWWAFNPAVWVGPLLVGLSKWLFVTHWWVYIVGPMVWWALAAWLYSMQEKT